MKNMQFAAIVDMKSGFHQLNLAESSRNVTTFNTGGVKGKAYRFRVTPMGLCASSQAFQRSMNFCLAMMEGKAMAFQDDICVFGETFEKFITNLRELLEIAKLWKLQFSDTNVYDTLDGLALAMVRR